MKPTDNEARVKITLRFPQKTVAQVDRIGNKLRRDPRLPYLSAGSITSQATWNEIVRAGCDTLEARYRKRRGV